MKRFFSFALIAAAGLLLTGCYEVDDTIANVYAVREEAGVEVPVSDATVRLYALGSLDTDNPGTPRFDTTQVTTDEGFTSFNFSSFYVCWTSRICRVGCGMHQGIIARFWFDQD